MSIFSWHRDMVIREELERYTNNLVPQIRQAERKRLLNEIDEMISREPERLITLNDFRFWRQRKY